MSHFPILRQNGDDFTRLIGEIDHDQAGIGNGGSAALAVRGDALVHRETILAAGMGEGLEIADDGEYSLFARGAGVLLDEQIDDPVAYFDGMQGKELAAVRSVGQARECLTFEGNDGYDGLGYFGNAQVGGAPGFFVAGDSQTFLTSEARKKPGMRAPGCDKTEVLLLIPIISGVCKKTGQVLMEKCR